MGLPTRCKSFLFEPRAYLQDPAVLRMSPLERGVYSTLLFSLWDMPEPGVVEDDDAILSTLSLSNGEWAQCRAAVSRAFDTTTRPGYWIQKRMVATFQAQTRRISRYIEAGRAGGKAKARNRKPSVARAMLYHPPRVPTENLVSNTPFEDFYRNYPRKENKPQARKAFSKVLPVEYEALAKGLERWKSHWSMGDPQFIPYPASFLNGRRWEDDPPVNGMRPSRGKVLMDLAQRMKLEEAQNGSK